MPVGWFSREDPFSQLKDDLPLVRSMGLGPSFGFEPSNILCFPSAVVENNVSQADHEQPLGDKQKE